jgi:hypothetical protein
VIDTAPACNMADVTGLEAQGLVQQVRRCVADSFDGV